MPWNRAPVVLVIDPNAQSGTRPRVAQRPYAGKHPMVWRGVPPGGWSDNGGPVLDLDFGSQSVTHVFGEGWGLHWLVPPGVALDQLTLQDLGWEHVIGHVLDEMGGDLFTLRPNMVGNDGVASVREMVGRMGEAGLRVGDISGGKQSTLGAWAMDTVWTELYCRSGLSSKEVQYTPLGNHVYLALAQSLAARDGQG